MLFSLLKAVGVGARAVTCPSVVCTNTSTR